VQGPPPWLTLNRHHKELRWRNGTYVVEMLGERRSYLALTGFY